MALSPEKVAPNGAAAKRPKAAPKLADEGPKDVPLPRDIRGEVKHRVENHQLSGEIPYQGVRYSFSYDKGSKLVTVTAPGTLPRTVSFTPSWM